MMRRRAMRRRGGPGLVGTVARTAVVAGTATVVAKGVSGAMNNKAAAQQAEAEAEMQNAADMQAMQQQIASLEAQQAAAAVPAGAPAAAPDLLTQLEQLGKLKEAGVLTDAEFAEAKAKLLG